MVPLVSLRLSSARIRTTHAYLSVATNHESRTVGFGVNQREA